MFPSPGLELAISQRSLDIFSEKWYFRTIIGAVMLIATRFAIVSGKKLGISLSFKEKLLHEFILILPNQTENYRIFYLFFLFQLSPLFYTENPGFQDTGHNRIRILQILIFLSTLHTQLSQNNITNTTTANI